MKKTIVLLAVFALVLALAPAAQAAAVVFNSSTQLNLSGRDVLAAVSLWDPARVGDGQSTVGSIQGVDFDDIDSTTQDTGAPIALTSGEAGATVAISPIVQSVGREFSLGGTFLPASADNTQAELLPSGALFQSNGTTTFTFGLGAGRANTDVEVQMVGGGVWNRTDKWGLLTAKVGGVDKDILFDRGTPDLITFSATTDALGVLAIDVVQTPGGSGTDRQWNVLGGMTVTTGSGGPPPATVTLYEEHFVDASIGHDQALGNSSTGWTGSGAWGDPYVGPHVHPVGGGYPNTPDGDDYHVQNHTGQSSSKWAVSKPAEFTVADADRNDTEFTVDFAANTTLGMKILANVGGQWYGSETFGTDDATNGAMDANGVTEWVEVSANADTGNWYEATGLPGGYDWRDGTRFSTTPIVGLPAGDITQFGVGFKHTGNGHYGAADNFRITVAGAAAVPEPSTFVLAALGLLGLSVVGWRRRKRT